MQSSDYVGKFEKIIADVPMNRQMKNKRVEVDSASLVGEDIDVDEDDMFIELERREAIMFPWMLGEAKLRHMVCVCVCVCVCVYVRIN